MRHRVAKQRQVILACWPAAGAYCLANWQTCSHFRWLVTCSLFDHYLVVLQVFVEYVMLNGVNDGEEQAHELGALLHGRDMTVNLIPWNPVYSPDIAFAAPGTERVQRFHSILRTQYDVPCTVRKEKGQDISGACGQLVIEQRGGPDRPVAETSSRTFPSTDRSVKDIEEIMPRICV